MRYYRLFYLKKGVNFMRKKFIIFTTILSVLFISACSGDQNELTGKTFNIAYAPILQEDVDNPSKYHSIMTLEFLDDNVISNTSNQMKGRYELTEDALMVQFETETET